VSIILFGTDSPYILGEWQASNSPSQREQAAMNFGERDTSRLGGAYERVAEMRLNRCAG